MCAALFAVALFATTGGHAAAAERPHRIVSLNLCTDDLVWRLADRDQIASLSFLSADKGLSLIADQIAGVSINYGRAEEVRLLDPDLVLAGTYGAQFAIAILKSRGYKVVEVPPAMGLADIAPDIELVGAAIGQPARAAAMAARVRSRIAELAATRPRAGVTAIVFQPRGFAAGAPSLASDVLTLAGARNLAAEAGFKDWVPLGVEGLLELDPELVVIDAAPNVSPSISGEVLKHRALRHFSEHHRLIRVDSNLWGCGTEETLKAVDEIRAALQAQSSGAQSFIDGGQEPLLSHGERMGEGLGKRDRVSFESPYLATKTEPPSPLGEGTDTSALRARNLGATHAD